MQGDVVYFPSYFHQPITIFAILFTSYLSLFWTEGEEVNSINSGLGSTFIFASSVPAVSFSVYHLAIMIFSWTVDDDLKKSFIYTLFREVNLEDIAIITFLLYATIAIFLSVYATRCISTREQCSDTLVFSSINFFALSFLYTQKWQDYGFTSSDITLALVAVLKIIAIAIVCSIAITCIVINIRNRASLDRTSSYLILQYFLDLLLFCYIVFLVIAFGVFILPIITIAMSNLPYNGTIVCFLTILAAYSIVFFEILYRSARIILLFLSKALYKLFTKFLKGVFFIWKYVGAVTIKSLCKLKITSRYCLPSMAWILAVFIIAYHPFAYKPSNYPNKNFNPLSAFINTDTQLDIDSNFTSFSDYISVDYADKNLECRGSFGWKYESAEELGIPLNHCEIVDEITASSALLAVIVSSRGRNLERENRRSIQRAEAVGGWLYDKGYERKSDTYVLNLGMRLFEREKREPHFQDDHLERALAVIEVSADWENQPPMSFDNVGVWVHKFVKRYLYHWEHSKCDLYDVNSYGKLMKIEGFDCNALTQFATEFSIK